ncbi:AraC family transcriptional regulator [Methyloceanibacter superfactus]|uniref:AraC family transcriptional regulator n=1 Tax=Methyloceanibacter superfactus TaxID=1774969 RepID=UPI000AE62457
MGFLLVPGFALMSYAAAMEPLRAANLLSGTTLYRWWHAAPRPEPVTASNGVAIIPDCGTGTDRKADMVFVCAGGNPATFADKPTFAWLRRLARRGTVLGGISGGPYILARAGLLDERRATLHWEHLPAFREAFPDVGVVPSLFEIDGNRITCSGGISALDMMVALIERDHGRQLAAAVGDWFLHTHIREGYGPQRMDLRYRLGIADEKLLGVLGAMEMSLETPLPRASWRARPAFRCGSSNACSMPMWATASTSITAGSGSSAPVSSCGKPRCRSLTWLWPRVSPRQASLPGPILVPSASHRAAPVLAPK